MYTDLDIYENKTCQILAWSSGAGRVISKLVTFADVVLTVSSFSLDETIVNTCFLVTYCCGQLIHCLKTSENKNNLKGCSSSQYHFSEINAKLAEENEFITHFVQKCLETRKNEQNVVLNESSEALGNRSEIVRILVLAMTTADDGVGGSNSV